MKAKTNQPFKGAVGVFDNPMRYLVSFRQMLKRALTLLNFGLFAALVAAGILLAKDAVSFIVKTPPQAKKEASGTLARRPGMSLSDYGPVLGENVFGLPGGNIAPLSKEGAGPLISLVLIGTVSGPGGKGYAIFEDRGMQEVFKTGDALAGHGVLKRVERGRIFVLINGVESEVPLCDISERRAKRAAPARPEAGRPFGGFAKRTSESSYVIDQGAVQSALGNPQQILTDARLLPNFKDGLQEGFVISEVRPGGLYNSLGLRNGDVLLRVNELDISAPEAALQAFTALRGLDRVELDVLRDGGRMTLTYNIR